MACQQPIWGSRWVVAFDLVSHSGFITCVLFSFSNSVIPFGRSAPIGGSSSKRQRVEEPDSGQTSQLGIVRTIGINQVRPLVFMVLCCVSGTFFLLYFCLSTCRLFSRNKGWSLEPESLRDGMEKSFSIAISVHWVSCAEKSCLCSLVVLALSFEVVLELASSRVA